MKTIDEFFAESDWCPNRPPNSEERLYALASLRAEMLGRIELQKSVDRPKNRSTYLGWAGRFFHLADRLGALALGCKNIPLMAYSATPGTAHLPNPRQESVPILEALRRVLSRAEEFDIFGGNPGSIDDILSDAFFEE